MQRACRVQLHKQKSAGKNTVANRLSNGGSTLINQDQLQSLDDEWQNLPNVTFPEELLHNSKNAEQFFIGFSKLRNDEDEPLFVALPKFAINILTLPTSNADAERIFSKINLTKTKIRNRLLTSTRAAIVRVSETVKNTGGCVKFILISIKIYILILSFTILIHSI